jgi:galactokinase/mevalonate kinase-like predicted kinase
MLFLVDPVDRERVFSRLREFGGVPHRCAFTSAGSTSWSINKTSVLAGP